MTSEELPDRRPFLVKYMEDTNKEPKLTISTPSNPFDFRKPAGQEHTAFNSGDELNRKLATKFKAHCQQRKDGERTVLVVFWHTTNRAPIVKERVVHDSDTWILSHDIEFLYILGDRMDSSGRNYVDVHRFTGSRGEWLARGVHDDVGGQCIFVRNVGVKRMPGFAAMSKAFKKAHVSL